MNKTFMDKICATCEKLGSCCKKAGGVWVDLEEAQKILALGVGRTFHHLIKDNTWPSGYAVSTTYENEDCPFLMEDGKCKIHFNKPYYCREFPFEDGNYLEYADDICYKLKPKLF